MVEDDVGPSGVPMLEKECTSEHIEAIDDVVYESSECDGKCLNALVSSLGIEGVDL